MASSLAVDVPGGLQEAAKYDLDGPLPPELWTLVLARLIPSYVDLKAARRVNSSFRDIATPILFDHVVFALDEKVTKNLNMLAKNSELSKHVRRLYLDLTNYGHSLDTRQYAQMTASHYQLVYKLPPQPTGPLSVGSLLRVLRADPLEELGKNCLSGTARARYVQGYAAYHGRADYYQEQLQDDGVYKTLIALLAKFDKINHFELLSLWTQRTPQSTKSPDTSPEIETFLRKTLPEASLKLIKGLKVSEPLNKLDKSSISQFCAPGVTARRMNPLMMPPRFHSCWGDSAVFDMVTGALRAFQESKCVLQTLIMPGGDDIRSLAPLEDRIGYIPLPSLLTVPRSTTNAPKKTLLLPLFEELKVLELRIDFSHPGTQNVSKHHLDLKRLCTAMQKLRKIETLGLGAVEYPPESQSEPWSIYEALLRTSEDKSDIMMTNANDPDDDDSDDGNGVLLNAPPGMHGFMNLAMLATALGIPGTPGGPLNPNATATPATASTSTPAASSSSNAPTGTPNTQPSPSGGDPPVPEPHPDTAITPNPWPNLRHLHLFNMPATKEDICRLIRTVSPSLKHLTLHNIYLEDPSPSSLSPISPPTYPYERIGPAWMSMLDLMASSLTSLDIADIFLGERNTDYVYDLLSSEIKHFDDVAIDLDDMINDYLVEEGSGGMGFAAYIGNFVAEVWAEMSVESDNEWEVDGNDDESEGTDDELPDLI